MAKVLDSNGLTYLWGKIKTELNGKASTNHIHNASNITYETGEESVEDGLNGCYNLLEGKANSSHAHGNITSGGDITASAPTIASGDQLVINDSSASKITNGPTFDGSTITQFLSKKGTWESVPVSLSTTSGSKSISSGTSYISSGKSFTLPAGIYALVGQAEFPSNTTGRRGLVWYAGSSSIDGTAVNTTPVSGVTTRIQTVAFVQPTSSTTYTLYCAQNSGSAQTVTFNLSCLRVA